MKNGEPYKLVQELRGLIESKSDSKLASVCKKLTNEDLQEALDELDRSEAAHCFKYIEQKRQPRIFGDLSIVNQNYIIRLLPQANVENILKNMPRDELHRFLDKVPRTKLRKIASSIKELAPETFERWQRYPKEQIGHWMSDDFFTVRPEWSVGESIERLKERKAEGAHIYGIIVTDEKGEILDKIMLDELVCVDGSMKISDVMDHQVAFLYVDDSIEKAIERFESRDTILMPIVDRNHIFCGVVSADDIMHLAQDKITEDMQKMGAVEASNEPFLQASVFEQFKKRGGWLLILFIGEMFTATAMGYYEDEISKAVVLALFLPLILSSGGNSGSQSSTLVIRALALREVRIGDWFKVFKRELFVGMLLGVLLGCVALMRIYLWDYLGWADYTEKGTFELLDITLAVSVGIVGIVAWGNLVGALLPLGLRLVRLDPATISAPFLATFVDVTGLIIYFTSAKYILNL